MNYEAAVDRARDEITAVLTHLDASVHGHQPEPAEQSGNATEAVTSAAADDPVESSVATDD